MNKTYFGKQLRRLRLTAGLSQLELSSVLGLSRPTIACFETKGKMPDEKVMHLIADYFHVTVSHLVTESDESHHTQYIQPTGQRKRTK